MRTHRILLALVIAASSLMVAQTAAKRPARAPETPAAARAAHGMSVDNVITMAQAGISEDVITARLRKENKPFDLSADDIIKLKKANVGDAVVRVMIDPAAELKPPQPSPAIAVPQPPAVVPIPAVVPASNPSGATPPAGSATAAGDPNDPMTPHDSGIYLFAKDRDGNPKLTVLERAAYQGSKTGGMLMATITSGIKKAKMKAILPGSRASIRISESIAEFYFYFEDKATGLGKSYFGISNLSNPNQFALIRLDSTKSNRETTIGEFGAFGASSGTDAKAMITFKSERLRPGLYRVRVDSLQPGEYCFLASSGAMGAYGAGAAGAMDIFDFGVNSGQ